MSYDNKSPILNKLQAYDAMYNFLDEEYRRTSGDEVGILLGGMSRDIWIDQRPADPGAWEQWGEVVQKTLNAKEADSENERPILTEVQAYDAMCSFLKEEYLLVPTDEILHLLNRMLTNKREGYKETHTSDVWEQWERAIQKTFDDHRSTFDVEDNE